MTKDEALAELGQVAQLTTFMPADAQPALSRKFVRALVAAANAGATLEECALVVSAA